MKTFPRRTVAALPGERVVDVEAVPVDGERSTRTLWEIVVARAWMILGFTALVVAVVAVWSFTARPYYESSTVIQIDPERPRVLSFADVNPREEPFNERVVDAYYQTQLELISSRTLLARVVDALELRRHPALQTKPGLVRALHDVVGDVRARHPAGGRRARVTRGVPRFAGRAGQDRADPAKPARPGDRAGAGPRAGRPHPQPDRPAVHRDDERPAAGDVAGGHEVARAAPGGAPDPGRAGRAAPSRSSSSSTTWSRPGRARRSSPSSSSTT